MSEQKEQNLIESFEDEDPNLWLPRRHIITHQPQASPPGAVSETFTEQPDPVQATSTKKPIDSSSSHAVVMKTPEKSDIFSEKSISISENLTGETEKSRSDTSKCADVSDLSFSRTSHISAIEREKHVSDKFNGVLYHVIPTYNQIAILFSTKGLYSQFISSLEKELHSRSTNKERPRYETHLNGQKCVIAGDQSESSVVVTGPARSLWRETTFLRMSVRLFSYFAADNVEETSLSHGTHALTSTPADQLRHQAHHSNILMSPIALPEPIQTMNCEEINKQLNILSGVTKTLQGQIDKINHIMNGLIHKVENIRQCSDLKKTTDQAPSVMVLSQNENDEVGAKTMCNLFDEGQPAVFPGTASYSAVTATNLKKTQNRTVAEKQSSETGSKNSLSKQSKIINKSPGRPIQTIIGRQTTQPKTLLIGDSILSGISKRGLHKNVECHPIPGATVDILMDKIRIFDLKCFENIIIYVAGNDAANIKTDLDLDTIEEKYEQFINFIQEKSAGIKIYLCSLCPREDISVEDINDMIKRQSQHHQGTFIDVYKTFHNKHNQLKTYFYNQRDNLHLSASGTKGLLGAINKHIEIVDDFKKCAQRTFSTGKIQYRPLQPRNDSSNERCFKCGLSNHKTSECFHKNQVQCFHCNYFGHKDSFCWNL